MKKKSPAFLTNMNGQVLPANRAARKWANNAAVVLMPVSCEFPIMYNGKNDKSPWGAGHAFYRPPVKLLSKKY